MKALSSALRKFADRLSPPEPPHRAPETEVAETPEWHKWGPPGYVGDQMAVWQRNTEFLRDPDFTRAYQLGMHTDHRQGGPSHPPDLHIEWRIHMCLWAAWHAKRLPGDFVECGTNAGIMSVAICDYVDFGASSKKFYLFDTFSGIPEEQISAEEEGAREQRKKYRDIYATAKNNFARWDNVTLVRGKIPDTLEVHPIDQISYLMIDMNIAAPERAALEFFWPKMVVGGIVLFDDYGWLGYSAQKRAHDEFAAAHGLKIATLPTGQGMLIKS